ncbi:hypothetical protein LRP67_16350 [Nocardioides sp. cx-169]|uniref:hypothetical protein n=1 Tax=Nocardioides sp. cx-169 TaxID=2899080 RepID=UPI001E3EBB76|nr:hypothetical protein [Nocardioides sp. cx-169]MCD4535665.1 hypothetical protein [Nocardioides sp. cx-169]
MTDLTAAIDAFLNKYPDNTPLTWQRRRKPNALDVMVADLLAAADRTTTNPTAVAAPKKKAQPEESE